jgi:hypothetical protein
MAGRRLASALSWRRFSAGHHQLEHPPPTADPAVPSSPSNAHVVHAAPAGGAVAAAPEGVALAGPSASPHLPVVGA